MSGLNERIAERLANEVGTLFGNGRRALALVYPSPYDVGMSSLGFQTIYRELNHFVDTVAERAFLPEAVDENLLTYESKRPVADFPVVAFSVAYELEITGVFSCLQTAGLPLLANERGPHHPLIVMGGPLTFSNPTPLAPFADVIVLGEAEDLLQNFLDIAFSGESRPEILKKLAAQNGFYVPTIHGEFLPPIAQCDDTKLPAYSAIQTPHTALSNMFLVETERGCSRGCTFCVMRRSTNGGMRLASPEHIFSKIPQHATRVGLVGAAVSDHPKIVQIIRWIVESGRGCSLSSLRADRLNDDFVHLLAQSGRTLTIASDGASERLRDGLEKKIREKHLLRAAALVRDHGMNHLKNYMMLGLPGETDDDLAELIDFTLKQADVAGKHVKVSLGIAPFVAKKQTPLDGAPFAGIKDVERKMDVLRRGLQHRIEIKPTSARWAWVEYQLAQGGPDAGLLALQAWRNGGSFGAWKRAFFDHDAMLTERAQRYAADRNELVVLSKNRHHEVARPLL